MHIHGYRRGKRAHYLKEQEVVVVTITAPQNSTQQHCEWLRPRGPAGGIVQVRTNRHGLYSRASNMLRTRYVRVRPHTICFLSTTYFMAWSEGVPYIFDRKNKGEIFVPLIVVKLRQEKVVVKVDSIHGRNQ